jgi:hypothetical protein
VRSGIAVDAVEGFMGQGVGGGDDVATGLLAPPVSWMNRLRLTGIFPATAFSALATCSSIPRRVRRARSWRYW